MSVNVGFSSAHGFIRAANARKSCSFTVRGKLDPLRVPDPSVLRVGLLPLLLPLPFAVAFCCHPEPIRAKRGWVRVLLLLSCFFFPASSFLLLLSCFFFLPSSFSVFFFPSPSSARHPEERSDEGSLSLRQREQHHCSRATPPARGVLCREPPSATSSALRV